MDPAEDLTAIQQSKTIDGEFNLSFSRTSGGPNHEDLNAKRLAFHAGPCWIKLLVADRVAGSIIGKGGRVITEIEQVCGCIMKLSPSMLSSKFQVYFLRSDLLSGYSGTNSGCFWIS